MLFEFNVFLNNHNELSRTDAWTHIFCHSYLRVLNSSSRDVQC